MFSKTDSETQNARSMMEGLHRFYTRATGTTVDPRLEEYFVNFDGVMNNNLHFLQDSQQEGKPNADATTEGQSVLIIGYLYCYLGTGDKKFLELAEWYWSAYVEWWYKHQPIPDTPQRWICNWIINGKEPVLANYPLNLTSPTHGGFKGVEFPWTNGFYKIPHGAPYWGEYLDVATFAFDGRLSYDSIKADVKAMKPDGSTDWDNDGKIYLVDWIILWNRKKVNWDGDILSENHTLEEVGSVQLQDTSLGGVHKFNFATRNPVEHGGYMIDRNEPFHNRPIQTPLGDNPKNMGNAADGEVWFLDACYLLWQATGQEKYKKALDSVHYTANEYTFIDSSNKFFRRDSTAQSPFTEGISYYYTYPDAEVVFERDAEGYIVMTPDVPCSASLEQKAVTFRVNSQSLVRSTYGGSDSAGQPIQAEVEIAISKIKSKEGLTYITSVPPKTSSEVEVVSIPITNFVRESDEDGNKYLLASDSATTDWGDCTASVHYTSGIGGETTPYPERTANTVKGTFTSDSGGLIIGFWLTDSETADVKSIVYRSDTDCDLKVEDINLWNWHWELPNTNGVWTKIDLPRFALKLNSYQGDHEDTEPRPTVPDYEELDQISISPSIETTGAVFEYYCVNDMPPAFDGDDGYVTRYAITLSSGDNTYSGLVGNCDIEKPREDSLAYSPGLIPFSNIYEPDSNEIGPWHGLPYPAYQAPSMYALGIGENQEIRLENSINFMYDSQIWYFNKYGVLGPTASAFVWDRWDATDFGPANEFTEYHWGDGKAWDGYQPRAFSWMCRCWQQIHDNGDKVPLKLKLFCENWMKYLWEFTERDDNPEKYLPYGYPIEHAPIPEDDFNAGMGGLYLSGICLAAMAGSKLPFIDELISRILVEFENNYTVLDGRADHLMNGSFTDWYGGNFFYGFHGAEAFKGLGSYLMYKRHIKGEVTNYQGRLPKNETTLAPPMHSTPIRPEGGGL